MMITQFVQLMVCYKILLEKCSNTQKKKKHKHFGKTSTCKVEVIISIDYSVIGKHESSACIRIKFIFPSSFLQKGHSGNFVLFSYTSQGSTKLKLSQLLVQLDDNCCVQWSMLFGLWTSTFKMFLFKQRWQVQRVDYYGKRLLRSGSLRHRGLGEPKVIWCGSRSKTAGWINGEQDGKCFFLLLCSHRFGDFLCTCAVCTHVI